MVCGCSFGAPFVRQSSARLLIAMFRLRKCNPSECQIDPKIQ